MGTPLIEYRNLRRSNACNSANSCTGAESEDPLDSGLQWIHTIQSLRLDSLSIYICGYSMLNKWNAKWTIKLHLRNYGKGKALCRFGSSSYKHFP